VGTGTVFKLINNLLGAVQIASLAEGVAIAEQTGLDMTLVAEALATGAVASPQVIRHSKRMIARDFSGASFTAALRRKDAAYAVALAKTLLADVPVSRTALAAYDAASAVAPDDDEGRMIEIVSRPK
jgi:3-hydroxyisobutyrate dehydrogenase-like beta-hydroxyacid dehydrogenase